MPFDILEPSGKLEHVPGTVLLQDNEQSAVHHTHIKKGTGKNADIVLVPQPSTSPNDPLNWPLWQRDLLLLMYCYLTVMCVGGIGPLIGVLALDMLLAFKIDFQHVTLLAGWQLCLVGACAPLVAACCHKYGKRPGALVAMLTLFAGTIWCALATSYNSMVGGRIIQGFGTAFFESITFTLVGDLYFVHERGSRMGFFVISQVGLVLFPSLMTGVVAQNLGWRWCFWMLAIFIGVGGILIIFFGWETAYNRNELYDLDTSSHDNVQIIEEIKGTSSHDENPMVSQIERTVTRASAASLTRHSFVKRMKPWSTTYSEDSLFRLILRPAYILANPVILWGVLLIAFFQLWNVVINFMLAQLFGPPPYLLNTAQLGYLGIGPMVGGVLVCLVFSGVSDFIVKRMAKRNGGIYEPEYRLITMLAAPVLSSIGYFLFGPAAVAVKSPIIMSTLWGFGFSSCVVVTATVSSYLVDAYRSVSIEIFVLSMCIKNFVFFGFSFFLNNWLAQWGPKKVFDTVGGLCLAMISTTVFVYIFGKKVRAWWHVHDVFKKN